MSVSVFIYWMHFSMWQNTMPCFTLCVHWCCQCAWVLRESQTMQSDRENNGKMNEQILNVTYFILNLIDVYQDQNIRWYVLNFPGYVCVFDAEWDECVNRSNSMQHMHNIIGFEVEDDRITKLSHHNPIKYK